MKQQALHKEASTNASVEAFLNHKTGCLMKVGLCKIDRKSV